MKKIMGFANVVFLSAILSFAVTTAFAQSDSTKNLPNFLFPEFVKCTVKFKSGKINSAVINYNVIDQEIVFLQNNTYMVLEEPQLIDTIFVSSRRFTPFATGFYEVVMVGKVSLFIQHKSYAEPLGTPTAYGVRSQSGSAVYKKQFYGATNSVDLKIPDGFKVVDNTEYLTRVNNTMANFTTKRQFLKIFKNKEKELSEFIDHNNIKFKSLSDIIKLFNYCNELYN